MGACRFLWRYFLMGTSTASSANVRQTLYNHLQTLPPPYYDRVKVGDVMAHATNDLTAVRMATHGHASPPSIPRPRRRERVDHGRHEFAADPPRALAAPVAHHIDGPVRRIVHARFTAVQEAFSRLTEKAQEAFSGIRVVKAYGDEASEAGYFAERAQTCAAENIRLAKTWGVFGPLISAWPPPAWRFSSVQAGVW